MDLPLMLANDADGLIRAFRFQYGVTALLQHGSREVSECFFVLDEQDGFSSAQRSGGTRSFRAHFFRCSGQVNLESRAVPQFAVHPDEAPALLDHTIDSRQS